MSTLDYRSSRFIFWLTIVIVVLLTFSSSLVSEYIQIDFLYIFPVTIASWYGSKKNGIVIASLSTLSLIVNLTLREEFNSLTLFGYIIPYFLAFAFLAVLVTNFRNVYQKESIAADTDALTNIANSRSFYAELESELERSSRYGHIFSLAYIDIDDFKQVNDTLGHSAGDKLLIEVAKSLQASLRGSDTIARLGGDEYACLLPETGQDSAKSAFIKVREHLQDKMQLNSWLVSFSIGLVTFETLPDNIKEAMSIADNLMYSVKKEKKDNISYKVWRGEITKL